MYSRAKKLKIPPGQFSEWIKNDIENTPYPGLYNNEPIIGSPCSDVDDLLDSP